MGRIRGRRAEVIAGGGSRRPARRKARLAPKFHSVLDRHQRNLATLVASLEAAGHAPDLVAACIRDLLATYDADLIQSLAAPEQP